MVVCTFLVPGRAFNIELLRGYKEYKSLPIVLLLLRGEIGERNRENIDLTACDECYGCYAGKHQSERAEALHFRMMLKGCIGM